jgi:hypothetical protein
MRGCARIANNELAEPDYIPSDQAQRRVRCHGHAVHPGVAGAVQVHEDDALRLYEQHSVTARDGQLIQHDVVRAIAADGGGAAQLNERSD